MVIGWYHCVRDAFRKILGVRFYVSDLEGLLDLVGQGGLIVFPSAPVMVRLADDPAHRAAMEGADFAVIILVDPKIPGNTIDAGRVVQDMELAAWSFGVASGIYTGVGEASLRSDYSIPESLKPMAVLGFGYPKRKILGKKNRKPLEELVFLEKYGAKLNAAGLS